MLYIKQLCLIIYTIITVLFTVGYASQPFIKTSQLIQTPNNADGNKLSSSFYINNVSSIISNVRNTYSSSNDYSNINNYLNILFQTILYTCITITILLVSGIALGFFGLKMISKILFLIAMILMIIVFIVIQVVILGDSFINNIKANGLNKNSISSINTENGNGYYLILTSTLLMIITYIIYAILA